MKKWNASGIIFILFIMFNAIVVDHSHAQQYVGEACWNFSNPTFGAIGTIRLGLTQMGNGHFLCSGVVSIEQPIVLQTPAHGNLELIGNEIRGTLSLAGIRNGLQGIEMHSFTLNPSTLNGTVKITGVFVDAVELSEATITLAPCN